MKKNQWMLPTMSKLNMSATQEGPHPTDDHDATTYDNKGNWWAGGQS